MAASPAVFFMMLFDSLPDLNVFCNEERSVFSAWLSLSLVSFRSGGDADMIFALANSCTPLFSWVRFRVSYSSSLTDRT